MAASATPATVPATPPAAPMPAALAAIPSTPDREKRFLTRAIEKSALLIKGLSVGFARRLKAITVGLWYGTGGQLTAEAKLAAKALGLQAANEKDIITAIASIMESTGRGVTKVLKGAAGVIGGVATTPLRMGGRALRAAQGTLSGALTGETMSPPDDNIPAGAAPASTY